MFWAATSNCISTQFNCYSHFSNISGMSGHDFDAAESITKISPIFSPGDMSNSSIASLEKHSFCLSNLSSGFFLKTFLDDCRTTAFDVLPNRLSFLACIGPSQVVVKI